MTIALKVKEKNAQLTGRDVQKWVQNRGSGGSLRPTPYLERAVAKDSCPCQPPRNALDIALVNDVGSGSPGTLRGDFIVLVPAR